MDSRAQTDEDVLTFDVPDDALERAASAEQQARHLGILHSSVVPLSVAAVAYLGVRQWTLSLDHLSLRFGDHRASAIRRASSSLSSLAADRRPGSSSK
jgi:hypothetical protein